MTETTITLPFPPSLNRIWRYSRRNGKPYLAERYKTWKRAADNLYLTQKRRVKRVKGPIDITIVFDAKHSGRCDLDNRPKAVLDWLQRVKLIENDKLVQKLELRWGDAPEGCRVTIRSTLRGIERRAA